MLSLMGRLIICILALAFCISVYQNYSTRAQLAEAIADRDAAIDTASDFAEQANLNARPMLQKW